MSLGYTPNHRCNAINETQLLIKHGLHNDSSASVVYGKCDISVTSNRSGNVREITKFECKADRFFPGGKHQTLVSEWDLVCERMGTPEIAQLMFTLGTMLGGMIVPGLSDRIGRKPVLCATVLLNVVIEFVISFSPNMYFVCGALIIDGMAFSGLSATYLVLGMEMLRSKQRRTYGVVTCYVWIGSVVLIGFIGYILQDVGWRYFQATGALMGTLAFGTFFFLQESPRWLAINGRFKDALAILKKAAKQNGKDLSEVSETFERYTKTIKPETDGTRNNGAERGDANGDLKTNDDLNGSNRKLTTTKVLPDEHKKIRKYTLLALLTKKDTLVVLLILWFEWTVCNLTYYGIFMQSSDLVGNRFFNFIILAVVELPANALVLFAMKRMGRLTILRSFFVLTSACLLASLLTNQFSDGSSLSNAFSVFMFIMGKFAITATFNTIFIFTPEVFPTVLRSAGNGSCKSVPRIGSMLAPYVRPLYVIAKWAPGLIFVSLCVIAFFLSFFLPETKGKILPTEIEDMTAKNGQACQMEDVDTEESDSL